MTSVVVAALLGGAVLVWPSGATVRAGAAVLRRPRAQPEPLDAAGVSPRGRWSRWTRWARWTRRRRPQDHSRLVLDLLDALAPALRAGLAPAAALTVVNQSGAASGHPRWWVSQLSAVEEAARQGEPLAPVWGRLASRISSPDLAVLARAWRISEQLGAPLADAATTAAAVLRARLDQQRRLHAATAGARATMNLLTLLPLGGIGVAALLGIAPWRLYAGSPLSAVCLVLGILLLLAGRRIVAGLIRRATRGAAG